MSTPTIIVITVSVPLLLTGFFAFYGQKAC